HAARRVRRRRTPLLPRRQPRSRGDEGDLPGTAQAGRQRGAGGPGPSPAQQLHQRHQGNAGARDRGVMSDADAVEVEVVTVEAAPTAVTDHEVTRAELSSAIRQGLDAVWTF